jgi:hypothetical protein
LYKCVSRVRAADRRHRDPLRAQSRFHHGRRLFPRSRRCGERARH